MKHHIIIFYICLAAAIGLFIGGFFVPPKGIIDGSVVTCGGIIFGFATIAKIPHMIEVSRMVKIQHGNMTIEAHGKENEENKKA